MTIKAIVFDRDGTLTDLNRTWAPAYKYMLSNLADGDEALAHEMGEAAGYDFHAGAFHPHSPIRVTTLVEQSKPWLKMLGREGDMELVSQIERWTVEKAAETITAFPDVKEVLERINQAGLPIGLATNGSEESAISQLKQLGLADYFCFIAGFDSGFGAKPEAGQLLAFADRVGVEPKHIAMVGDSLHDMHAAHKAGMVRVGVATGVLSAEEFEGHSDVTLSTLAGLKQVLGLRDMALNL
ncbi:HAD family hydrolase [Pseudovibrio sp. SPO723]|uniref:HAD family hydrolase n=1 Tax=Nesiotobacter zosterae TaxID=392721 RepID=UPI0029C5E27F|nr:HAD family hydrolase [Pseudovibrio sp. SPO723]MDX5593133.1 HAD family hydrolase [Pseudovibrio sp. SPO723]